MVGRQRAGRGVCCCCRRQRSVELERVLLTVLLLHSRQSSNRELLSASRKSRWRRSEYRPALVVAAVHSY